MKPEAQFLGIRDVSHCSPESTTHWVVPLVECSVVKVVGQRAGVVNAGGVGWGCERRGVWGACPPLESSWSSMPSYSCSATIRDSLGGEPPQPPDSRGLVPGE